MVDASLQPKRSETLTVIPGMVAAGDPNPFPGHRKTKGHYFMLGRALSCIATMPCA